MKRIIATVLCLVLALSLFGCAVTEESGFESTLEAIKEAEMITAYFYGDEEEPILEVEVTDELCDLMKGQWSAKDSLPEGEKVITVSLGEHHEVTFFDDGSAVIYYGFAGITEKDRCYYSVELESELSELCDWCIDHGTVPEEKE